MAVGSDKYAKVVLSTDTKPTGAFPGQLIIESDTGSAFEWDGTSWRQITTAGAAHTLGTNTSGTPVDLATEATVSQLVMAVNNAIDETAYDLNAAAFSETTSITDDFIFDSIELNFSTAEVKTITITSSDGTIIWGGSEDTTAANRGYQTTAKNFFLEFNRGFVANDNITVDVTQFSSAGTMDCVLKTRSGSNALTGAPGIKWSDTEGTIRGFKNASGRPRISTVPYKHEIAAGNLADHIRLPGFGEKSSMPTPTGGIGVDVWEGPTDVIPHPPVAGEQMTVVSTSVEDDPTGTGMGTIRIEYIDGNGAAQTEDITLDGTTNVDTVATDIAFVNHMFSTSVGSGSINRVAAGDITIFKKAAPNTVYNIIKAGGNKDLTCAIRIPANVTYFINEWHCSVAGNKPTAVRLRSTDWNGVLYNGDDSVFIFKDTAYLAEGNFDRDLDPPIPVPGGSTIKASGWATQSGPFVSGSFGGFYE
jgi:hypothetical protein